MPKYAFHNDDGDILNILECDEDLLPYNVKPGDKYCQVDSDTKPWDKINLITGHVVKQDQPKPLEPPRGPEWLENRKINYPRVEEQLDLLWHAMDQGLLPKNNAFYEHIKLVKQSYPKNGGSDPTII